MPKAIRLAAVGDLHFGRTTLSTLQPLLAQVVERADVFLICGDLTDSGHPEEARVVARELGALKIPTIAVLGNHDYESGKEEEVSRILCDAGVRVLNGDAYEMQGIGFAGVKGFAGGFGRRALGPWGEAAIKGFVREALDEALKLESALGRMRADHRIVLLHYSPIEATVRGEPLEIYPFLGSSRLEEPLSRYPVDFIFHGHAHHGALEGQTMSGARVYNVSMSLLQRSYPGAPPFRVVEIPAGLPTA